MMFLTFWPTNEYKKFYWFPLLFVVKEKDKLRDMNSQLRFE